MRKSGSSVADGGPGALARPHEPATTQENDQGAPTAWAHLPTALVMLLTLGMTTVLAVISHNVTQGQERTLLKERVSEVVLVLQASINPIQASLAGAGAVASDQGESPLFATLATGLTANGGQMLVVKKDGAAFVQIAAAGDGTPGVGKPVPTAVAPVLARALTSKGLVSGMVTVDSGSRLILAMAVGADTVAYLSSPIDPTANAANPDPNSPYRELDLAVYASAEATPASLLLTSGSAPGTDGETAQQALPLGVDSWLVVASSNKPLVGRFAVQAPWFIGGVGLLLAIVLAIGVELILRRRAYALRLVEERTASLREAQQAAEKASRAKSEFLSRMSHELRTPLNAVLGFAQLLSMNGLTEEQSDSVLQISRGGRHLLDLINEILDISRIETGTLSISLEPVLVADVVADVASLVRTIADDRGISVGVDTGPVGEAYIAADRRRVKQILLNLMANAIKYNHEGGLVSLSCTTPSPGRVRITVADNGPGIDESKFPLLFEPFERLGAEATAVEGTGVGLALSKGLAEAMGGTIGFSSQLGEGSSFWLEVPVSEGPEMPSLEDLAQSVAPDPGGDRRTVLCVEDNPTNLKLVERVLALRPHVRLVSTPNGAPVVEMARQSEASLILLDMNLGDMSGSDVLLALRDNPATAEIPVVVVSADATPARVERLMREGASAYLTKPIDVEELLAVVDQMVADASAEVV